jgi:hypothetical protein
VTDEQLDLGKRAWDAFRAAEPGALEDLWRRQPGALPYLGDAILRWLQELPAVTSGLSRTERTALEEIARQPRSREQVFGAVQAREERPFMGDWSFWRLLERLEHSAVALLCQETAPAWPVPAGAAHAAQQQVLALTPAGRAGLAAGGVAPDCGRLTAFGAGMVRTRARWDPVDSRLAHRRRAGLCGISRQQWHGVSHELGGRRPTE